MIAGGNADGNWSEKRMEGEDFFRTVECLRGRLQAERVASRASKQEADQIGNKLVELENQLRKEIKSRNRAEKKLNFLRKKLESLNISYVSEDSLEKSDISSVSSYSSSSMASSAPKEAEDKEIKTQLTVPKNCEIETIKEKTTVSDLQQNGHCSYCPPIEETPNSTSIANGEKPGEDKMGQNCADDQSLKPSNEEKEKEEESSEEEEDDYVDNTLALVPIDLPNMGQKRIEPPITNARIQQVLDDLRHAREKLQTSMGRRRSHMIRVG